MSRRTFCKINCKSIGNFKSLNGSIANSLSHRTRSISNNHNISCTLNSIRKILPKSFKSFINLPSVILMNNFMREQSSCINLSFTLLYCIQKQSTTVFVMSQKCIVVKKISLGRNSFIVNFFPILIRHLSFYNINVSTKIRKSLTILTRRHVKSIHHHICITSGKGRGRIFRTSPLSTKRNRLIILHVLDIFTNLICKPLKNSVLTRSFKKNPEIINSSIFLNIRN